MPETIKIGKRAFSILFPEIMRPLTTVERQALKASIRRQGVTAPVIVDEDNGVIDGANRLRLAAEIGLDNVPVHVKPGLSEQEKAELALSLNDARRHLKPSEFQALQENRKERIARVVSLRAEGESLRMIAEKEGVSDTVIREDIKKAATANPLAVTAPEKVTGRDGRTVKATRERPPAEPRRDTFLTRPQFDTPPPPALPAPAVEEAAPAPGLPPDSQIEAEVKAWREEAATPADNAGACLADAIMSEINARLATSGEAVRRVAVRLIIQRLKAA